MIPAKENRIRMNIMPTHLNSDSFVHLEVYSDYGGQGSCRIPDILDKAVEYRMPSVALTDFNTLGGAVEFHARALKRGIKPIIGCSMVIADGKSPEDCSLLNVVLLATGPRGYGNLCRLVSSLADHDEYSNEAIDRDFFLNNCRGLICLAKDRSCLIPKKSIMKYHEALGKGNLYLLTLPSYPSSHHIYDNKKLTAYSKKIGIPIVATNHVIFMSPDDFQVHEIHKSLMSGNSTEIKNLVARDPVIQWYFKSAEKMRVLLQDLPEAADNTIEIAERCNFSLQLESANAPPVIGIRHKRKIEDILMAECSKGLNSLYPGKMRVAAEKKMHSELEVIIELALCEQFLFLKDMFDYARIRGIPLLPDFPSAGTMTAYLLGIGQADPLKHDLVFERYINPLRKPIFMNMRFMCSHEDRSELLKYLSRKYGNMAIPTHYRKHIRDSAFEDVLRREKNSDLQERLDSLIVSSAPHKAAIAIRPEGFRFPLPFDKSIGPLSIAQLPMFSCERLGMPMLEILPLNVFSAINNMLGQIEKETGNLIIFGRIGYDDSKVLKLFEKGDTEGIWEFGLKPFKNLCMKAGVKRFEDLISIYALCQPGAEGLADEYLERKKKSGITPATHPIVAQILAETHGMMLYQEQILQILSSIGGFDMAESDMIRKSIALRKMSKYGSSSTEFIKGAIERGMSSKDARKLWETIFSRTNYAYIKSFAVTYVLFAYRMAYLKTYYRKIFDEAIKGCPGMEKEYDDYFSQQY